MEDTNRDAARRAAEIEDVTATEGMTDLSAGEADAAVGGISAPVSLGSSFDNLTLTKTTLATHNYRTTVGDALVAHTYQQVIGEPSE
jgi:hypothetical protein